jgi:hypothetical protein
VRCKRLELAETLAIIGPVETRGRKREAVVVEDPLQTLDDLEHVLVEHRRRHEDGQQPFLVLDEIVQGQVALALGGASLAERQQPAETSVCGPVGGIDQDGSLVQVQPAPHHERDTCFLCGHVRADDPGQRVAVGDRHGGMAERSGALDQLLGAPRRNEKLLVTASSA